MEKITIKYNGQEFEVHPVTATILAVVTDIKIIIDRNEYDIDDPRVYDLFLNFNLVPFYYLDEATDVLTSARENSSKN